MSALAVVVLDRDGTLIEDRHYINQESDVIFLPGAIEALKTLKRKGYPLFLVSNQSGVGRGLISEEQFHKVHRRFIDVLKENEIALDQIAYCFHPPEDACPCRKPAIGLLPRDFQGQAIDWARSYIVGDHVPDMELARNIGAAPCLVLTGKGTVTHSHPLPPATQVFETVSEFASSVPVSHSA